MATGQLEQAPCRLRGLWKKQRARSGVQKTHRGRVALAKLLRMTRSAPDNSEALRVLILEDEPTDAELTVVALGEGGFHTLPTLASGRASFEAAFAPGRFDLVLADYSLPDYTGLEALALVRRSDSLVPFMLVSGALGEERAVEALRAGATDYILKHGLARLAPAVRRALSERRERERHLATSRALELSQERLRALSRRLLEVQEDERRSLARDLHDDIGQVLTALKIQLQSLSRASQGTLPRQIEECVATTGHALERVRQLSLSLRPLQLDDLGLIAALRSHLDRQASVGGLTPHFDAGEAPQTLASEIETACFRVAQEAITNVLRHARAKHLWVRVFMEEGRLALSVRDDGAGFDLEAARRRAAAGGSLGVVGMEERVALAGGSFELRTGPGQGTVMLATFPLSPKQEAPSA
jgi:signal transduction histidine kinase